eukprot:c23276_g3_i1 orf=240-3296(-)
MCAYPLIYSREGMDSSTEEEDEEFFETVEDVASSSDAESGVEERHGMNAFQGAMASAPNGVSFPLSKYEVWKNSPGSILERRQRLFTQMGLEVEREDSEGSVVLVDAAPAEASLTPSSSYPKVGHVHQSSRNTDRSDQEVLSKKGVYAPGAGAGWSMVRSRSDGTFSRLQSSDSAAGSLSLRLVSSGTTSPLLHHRGHERLTDSNGAVLGTGSGQNHPTSKPPLGGKRGNANSTSVSAEGLAARRLQFQWNKFGRFRVTDKNGNSLFDSTSPDVCITDRASEEVLAAARPPLGNSGDAVNSKDGEVLCRIKDLDSGKEFVVNEVGKDGMWNKLKELDTGREITLEEFESSLGLSPIVQEVMRRERAAGDTSAVVDRQVDAGAGVQKRKKSWFKAIKGVVRGSREKGNHSHHGSGSDDREGSTEKSGRKSGSATDDSQDVPPASRPVKVHTHKKAAKEFADLRLRQEIQAHQGAIWTMKFSLDGSYLATAGQDKVVRVWEVLVHNGRSYESPNSSGELNLGPDKVINDNVLQRHSELKRRSKSTSGRKTVSSRLPMLFMLSENAKCAFKGHTEDILDLSWSPSQYLLSSSMDKTVRLWNVSSKACLKLFTHNDYVTCIQFHPLDAGHFISGSLDGKVRIWSIQEPQVVDWVDLQEMVTAACYTPNGQGAVVGSYKGTCRFYKTSGNKLQPETTFEVRSNKAKRSQGKKITGFQFVPGDKKKILITSSDSRIRVYDGTEISSKFKGFRNTNSQISASLSTDGGFIICASEDSRVCIWNYNDSRQYPGQQSKASGSYEDFSVKHVLLAIPWPGMDSHLDSGDPQKVGSSLNHKKEGSMLKTSPVSGGHSARSLSSNLLEAESVISHEESLSHRSGSDDTSSSAATGNTRELTGLMSTLSDLQDAEFPEDFSSLTPHRPDIYQENSCGSPVLSNCVSAQHIGNNGSSKGSATWPEEKLPSLQEDLLRNAVNHNTFSVSNKDVATKEHVNTTAMGSAWGMVIVTAGLGGEIRIFQNYSLPVRL